MISPSFFGLYNASRGLLTAQMALNTVNHNISNANTPGYSRQQADISSYLPYTFPNLSQNLSSGQIGQGSFVEQINRVRDSFVDTQYRLENAVNGQNTQMRDVLAQIEAIVGEPSHAGVNDALQKFFDAANELSIHPENTAVRTDYVQQAIDLVNVFQQQGNQLQNLRNSLVGNPTAPVSVSNSQLAVLTDSVNEKLTTIAGLNRQILTITSTGAQPNDLLDQRDQLIDELSELVDVSVSLKPSNQIDISIGGTTFAKGVTLVDTLQVVANPGPIPTPDNVPALVQTVNGATTINNNFTGGKIRGLLNMAETSTTLSTIRDVLGQLNTLIVNVANQVNALQLSGRRADGAIATQPIFDLQAGATLEIFRYRVDPTVAANPNEVAAAIDDPLASGPPAGFAGIGDGRNALAVAQLRSSSIAALGNTTFGNYFNGMVSSLGIDSKTYQDRSDSQGNVIHSLDLRRQSISGVNTEEELIDMIRFQRAFEASSKMISVFDQVAQTIINMA